VYEKLVSTEETPMLNITLSYLGSLHTPKEGT
jgi:hypothetical protein